MITISAGPRRISHSVGNTQPTVGRRIFSEARAASARIFRRRLTRICAACAAMVRAIGTPVRSACRIERTRPAKSSTPVGDHVQSVRQDRLELSAPFADELAQPEHRQVEAEHRAADEPNRDRQRLSDQDSKRRSKRAQPGRRGDAQRLHARGVQAEWVADEVELALEPGGLGRRGQTGHLARDRLAQRIEQALEQRTLELERDGALAEPKLLSDQALAQQGGRVGGLGGTHSERDERHARGGDHAEQHRDRVHWIAVMRRMMNVPVASSSAAKKRITQPRKLVNSGRK